MLKNYQNHFLTVLTPSSETNDFIYLQEYFIKNSANILQDVKNTGIIVFRNFYIKSPNEALSVLKLLGLKNHQYKQVSPRRHIIVGTQNKQILNNDSLFMLSTQEAENNQTIPFHNELLQTLDFPEVRALYCQLPAIKGGQISFINTKNLYQFIHQKHTSFQKQLTEKKIRYVRTIAEKENPQHQHQRGWKQIFNVKSRLQADKKMKQLNYQVQWLDNQSNQCVLKGPIINPIQITQKGQKLFANQILKFYQQQKIKSYKSNQKAVFGNGQELPSDILQNILNYTKQNKTKFNLQKGDLIILDNLKIMTSRQPFEGPLRKVSTCLMSGISQRQKKLNLVLKNGYQMPLIGFGTWKLQNQKAQKIVYYAIKNGYRHIDCASVYANQEKIGLAIKKAIDAKLVRRQQLFIVSKLWNTYHRPQNVKKALMRTLKDLQLQYLDLYLMHFPVSLKYVPIQQRYPTDWVHDPNSSKPYIYQDPVPNVVTWKAMQKLVNEGLVRNIGVSNFNIGLLRQIIFSSTIKPSVLQIQLHPQLTQKNLIRFAREQGLQITSYSTFGASSYIPLGFAEQNEPIFKHPLIKDLSEKYKKSTHQIILRWAIQQGYSIIPKSNKEQRMKENLDLLDFRIQSEDMKSIDQLNRNKMYNDPARFSQKQWGTFYPIHD